jgi:hypothetical protein
MWASLSRAQQRFLLVDELGGSVVVNLPVNAAIAWVLFRSPSVPLWGWSSIAADTLVTAFMLPLLTAVFATRVARARVAAGKLPRITTHSFVWLPRWSIYRGTLLGVAALILVAAPVVAAFALVGPASLSRWSFVWFKAIFATGLGVLVTPLIGWWALCDAVAC